MEEIGIQPAEKRKKQRTKPEGQVICLSKVRCFFVFILFFNVLIGLTQQSTRCSDGSSQAHEDLIAGFSAIEAEAELVQVRLKVTVKPPRASA